MDQSQTFCAEKRSLASVAGRAQQVPYSFQHEPLASQHMARFKNHETNFHGFMVSPCFTISPWNKMKACQCCQWLKSAPRPNINSEDHSFSTCQANSWLTWKDLESNLVAYRISNSFKLMSYNSHHTCLSVLGTDGVAPLESTQRSVYSRKAGCVQKGKRIQKLPLLLQELFNERGWNRFTLWSILKLVQNIDHTTTQYPNATARLASSLSPGASCARARPLATGEALIAWELCHPGLGSKTAYVIACCELSELMRFLTQCLFGA